MRWMTRLVAVAVMCLAWPTQAYACYFAKHFSFNPIPGAMTFGGGLYIEPDDDIGMIINGEANFPIANGKGVVSPLVGLCKEGDFNELTFGVAGAWQVWKDASGNADVNVQTGLGITSYDGGNDRVIPLGAAYRKKMSEMMAWFAGANIVLNSYSYDAGPGFGDVSGSDTDPALWGGIVRRLGAIELILSGGLQMAYETAFFASASVTTTGAANAIRSFVTKIK